MRADMPKLTTEDVRALAKIEYEMDIGIRPYVVWAGNRSAFSAEVLEECGCVSGQTVSRELWIALIEHTIAFIEAKKVIDTAREQS